MPIKIFSCQIVGLEGKLVEVEADILPGLPSFKIIGLGDAAVQESKHRLKSAIKNTSTKYPQQKKVISLAPAAIKKYGTAFDLPIALGILAAAGEIEAGALRETLVLGELALDGKLRPVPGILSVAIFAKQNGWRKIILPAENFSEASLIEDLEIAGFEKLEEVLEYLKSGIIPPIPESVLNPFDSARGLRQVQGEEIESTYQFVQGQEGAKKALQIAAAGGHHLLFYGPPGVGKTMLARSLRELLPKLSQEEMFEIIQIYSAANLLSEINLQNPQRPFRSVHQSSSMISLIGGGAVVRPGEISLAHHGVLFLDEIAEFPRNLIEVLRQPLEENKIHISRAQGNFVFPANFSLVAAMNPCPCGYFGHSQKPCICNPQAISNYQKKISGPIFDRLDMTVKLDWLPFELRRGEAENSAKELREIKNKIFEARERQRFRYKNSRIKLNFQLSSREINKYIFLTDKAEEYLKIISQKCTLSARSFLHLLKTALTIADLKGAKKIDNIELAEAFGYRQNIFDR